MKNTLRHIGFALFALLATAVSASAQANVAGTWSITIDAPEAPGEVIAVFAQDGATVTGAFQVPMAGGSEMTDGKIEGDKLTFVLHVDIEGQWFSVQCEATVAEDTMEGSFYMSEIGTMPFTARRTD